MTRKLDIFHAPHSIMKTVRSIILAFLLLATSACASAFTESYGFEVGLDFGPGFTRNDDLTQSFQRLDWIFLSDNQAQNKWQQYRHIAERRRVHFDRPTKLSDLGFCFVFKKRLFYDYIIKEKLRIGFVRMENFGSDVLLRFYEEDTYDAICQYKQDWSGSAVSLTFCQYFGVGGEVWEAYVGYGLGINKGKLTFRWVAREGKNDDNPDWDAWYMDGATKKHYSVEQLVEGEMSSTWGFEQLMLAELNRKLVGSLYLCLEANFHWVWLEEYRGHYEVKYIYNDNLLIDENGEGVLLILKDVIGIQPVVVPVEELPSGQDYRPLTVDFVGPRLLFSLRFFF